MPDQIHHSVTTAELVAEMAKLRSAMLEAREKRHEGNGALNDAFLAFQNTTEEQGARLEVVEKVMLHDMPQLVRDIQIIKMRLVGDDAMKTGGLVQQMNALDHRIESMEPQVDTIKEVAERVKTVETKLDTVTTLATATSWDLKVMKIVGGAVGTVVVALGGLVTWAKATAIVDFLRKP